MSKLTIDQKKQILDASERNNNQSDLARQFNVSTKTIRNILQPENKRKLLEAIEIGADPKRCREPIAVETENENDGFADLWEEFQEKCDNDGAGLEEYMTVDDLVETAGTLTLTECAESVLDASQESDDEEEIEEDPVPEIPPVTRQQALAAFATFKRYVQVNSGIKQSIAFLAILAISYSTGKFVGLNDLVSLSGTFAKGDGPVVGPNSSLCRSYCRSIVGVWDQYFPDAPPNPTPEAMAAGTRVGFYNNPELTNPRILGMCQWTFRRSVSGCVESDREGGENTNLYQEFCAALVELHRELVFAKAYFEHRKNKTVDPCVVAGIC